MNPTEQQFEEDRKQIESLEQSTLEDLAVDPNVEQPSQETIVVLTSDEGAEG